MLNNDIKKEAIRDYDTAYKKYEVARDEMNLASERLYGLRKKSESLIQYIEGIVNSIARTPKSFNTDFGEVHLDLKKFKETEQYAEEAYKDLVKANKNVAKGIGAGATFATMTPTALVGIASTFGTASTGTAISTLSGAAAKKATSAWIGRTLAGFAVKEGTAGMLVGDTILALAGPIGW